jgi:hypothetical protein
VNKNIPLKITVNFFYLELMTYIGIYLSEIHYESVLDSLNIAYNLGANVLQIH